MHENTSATLLAGFPDESRAGEAPRTQDIVLEQSLDGRTQMATIHGPTSHEPPAPGPAPEYLTTLDVVVQPLLFGRYRYLRELGRGGMGVVSLAHDEVLGIPVALKLVPEAVAHSAEDLDALRKEVLRGIALTHSGIVRVYSFEKDAQTAAIVMEYVDGESLADLKARQPGRCFEPETLRPWLEQLCGILDYAHGEAKIAHRDLKPRNLMLTREGRLKVADFGVASSLSETMAGVSIRSDSSGTPPYMSPQQAMGERPTGGDDLYAVGATLYDLLTGKPPFFRGNIIAQLLQEPPAAMNDRRAELGVEGRPPIPAAWERVVAACLEKDPSRRPPSGAALLQLLDIAPHALVPYAPRPAVPLETLRLDNPVPVQMVAPRVIPPPVVVVCMNPGPALLRRAGGSVASGLVALLTWLRDEVLAWTRRLAYFAMILGAGLALLYAAQAWSRFAPAPKPAARAAAEPAAPAPPAFVPPPPPFHPGPPPGWVPPPGPHPPFGVPPPRGPR